MPRYHKDLLFYIRDNFFAFFGVFFLTVFVSYLFLYLIDVYPEPKTATEAEEVMVEAVEDAVALTSGVHVEHGDEQEMVVQTGEMPVQISLDSIGREVTVLNPVSADLATLEADLQKGVIRHPDSAELGQDGNVVILGHSSYLPNVINKNYQAFNGIQDMKWGDTVTVASENTVYTYRVDRVYKATTDEVVPVDGDEQTLTLVTCNVFGSKQDRYILEATLTAQEAV